MRPIIVGVVAASLLAIPASAPAATSCGAVNGGFENTIRATNISCVPARKLVRRWHRQAVKEGRGGVTQYVGSYYCRARQTDPEHVKVSCTYGDHRVTFFAGP